MVCKEYDNYVEEHEPCWIVVLSNGETIYQDDERYIETPSSWIRLEQYIRNNNLKIIRLVLKFRSHYEELPQNKDGYFFVNQITKDLFGPQKSYFITGYLESNCLICQKWALPELIKVNEYSRELDGFGLIKN